MDGMHQVHQVPTGDGGFPLGEALSQLRRLGDQCILLELTLQSARWQEDRIRWESERFDCKPVQRLESAAADFCDETLSAYLSAVVTYTAAAAGVWKQLERGQPPSVDEVAFAGAYVEDLRGFLSSTPALPEGRRDRRTEALKAVDDLAHRLRANELPADTALHELESPDELAIGEVVRRLHDYGQDCHWAIYVRRSG